MYLTTRLSVFWLLLAIINFVFICGDDTEAKKFTITFKCYDDKVFFEPIERFNAIFGEEQSPVDDSLPEDWSPCKCIEVMFDEAPVKWDCECCAGIGYGDDFYQELKFYVAFKLSPLYVTIMLMRNTYPIVEILFSAFNPPPICVPILLPIPALPCFSVYNVQYNEDNIYFCMDLKAKIFMVEKDYEYYFGCVRVSAKGFEFFELPNGDVGPRLR